MILVIDNYDSFTYNLVQYLGEMGEQIVVKRNDEIDLAFIDQLKPDKIVISPGPCTPKEAGISVETITRYAGKVPLLGVCLGHQSIGAAFGGEIIRATRPMHGKTSLIYHDGRGLFTGLDNPFVATRYHSLIINRECVPECLTISAWTEEGEIMGVRHKTLPVEGVQFHPESVLTKDGKQLLRNFVTGEWKPAVPKAIV
ncbi:MAG: aminodeoxychorismate/anthranilate synthase component II [Armatimonadota bacterium]